MADSVITNTIFDEEIAQLEKRRVEIEAERQGPLDTSAHARGTETVQERPRWRRCWVCGDEFGRRGEDSGQNRWETAVPLGCL